MEEKPKSRLQPPEEQSFLQRYAPAIAVLVVFTIIIASIVGTMMVLRRNSPAVSPTIIETANLPGPRNKLSERSKKQLATMAKQNSNILAVVVIATKYSKNENQIIYAWAEKPDVRKVIEDIIIGLDVRQSGPGAMSSEDVQREAMKDPNKAARLLRNSEEARMGLIKCVPISETALVNESLRAVATGICIATIPPFAGNSAMSIIVLTNSGLTEFSELAEMRRILLTLQVDIYNRDFKGRETWAHP